VSAQLSTFHGGLSCSSLNKHHHVIYDHHAVPPFPVVFTFASITFSYIKCLLTVFVFHEMTEMRSALFTAGPKEILAVKTYLLNGWKVCESQKNKKKQNKNP
jgi:hypothetical protein